MAFVQTMDQLLLVVFCIARYQDCYQTIPSSNESYMDIRDIAIYILISNRNDTSRIASMVLSTQILGGLSFAQGQDPIELNFQLTVSACSLHSDKVIICMII